MIIIMQIDCVSSVSPRVTIVSKPVLAPVADIDWKEVKQRISDITGRECDHSVAAAIQKASFATCFSRRGSNSRYRIDAHERLVRGADSAEKKAYHERNASNARNKIPGVGTGRLLSPRSALRYLVITNNHVITNEEEAKDAKLIFD